MCHGFWSHPTQHTTSHLRCTVCANASTNYDYTDLTHLCTGSVIETNIGILAASIPSYKSLFKRYMPHLIGDYSNSSKMNSTGNKLDTKGRPNTNTDKSRSGFVELNENSNRASHGVELENMYKVGTTNNINTNISSGKYGSSFLTTPNSSEEMVSIPPLSFLHFPPSAAHSARLTLYRADCASSWRYSYPDIGVASILLGTGTENTMLIGQQDQLYMKSHLSLTE